jgi:hypothetical protein
VLLRNLPLATGAKKQTILTYPLFPVDLYSWAMVYSMKRGVSALRVVS